MAITIVCYVQAEARAEFAERSVQKLQKEVDRLEGEKKYFMNLRGSSFSCKWFILLNMKQPNLVLFSDNSKSVTKMRISSESTKKIFDKQNYRNCDIKLIIA